MHFHILTLFPDMVTGGLNTSILGRACQKGLIGLHAVNIRDYTKDRHKKVDDYPYGGGAGMLMQAQPVYDAFCAVRDAVQKRGGKKDLRVIYVTPQGRVFDQEMARQLAREEDLVFLCGHYEGVDERVLEEIVTDQVSIGDYVLTGGELPAMVMIDAISRMVPGVLKNEASGERESFHQNLLEYPQYTRPEVWHSKQVPQVLLSGDHARVETWRLERSVERTRERRPDLYEKYDLPGRALTWLMRDRLHHMDMIEAVRRGRAGVAALREDGVLLRSPESGLAMISAENRDAGERLLSCLAGEETLVCHQPFLAESAAARFGREGALACRQAVYTKKTPLPEGAGVRIRVLEGADLEGLPECFLETLRGCFGRERAEESLGAALRGERVFGAFLPESSIPAGCIAVRREGGIGALAVQEPFRRRGIGTALESRMINRALSAGNTPYVQGNGEEGPFWSLQKKLGLRADTKKIYRICAKKTCNSPWPVL